MAEKTILSLRIDTETEDTLTAIMERNNCDKAEAVRQAIAAFNSPPAPPTPALDPAVIEQIRAAVQGVGSLRGTVDKLASAINQTAANQTALLAEFVRFLGSHKQLSDETNQKFAFTIIGLSILAEKDGFIDNLRVQYESWKTEQDRLRLALNG